ncbi:MAG TPA: hypothetical protein VFQ00_05440 [Terriglobales bacterium]|nr:hypothetical protein [Terriglobales bacterium]
MTKALLALAATGLFALSASAQTGAQANGSASTNTSVQAGQTGATANTQSSADVTAQTPSNASSQHKRHSRHAEDSNEPAVGGNASGQGSFAAGTKIPATLNKSVDARKAKPGDEITAKTTQNVRSESGVTIPRGSRLIGHVTEANARAKGDSESALGIAFDRAVLKNGQEIPFNASIQAIAAAASTANMNDVDDSMGAMGNAGASAGMPAPSRGANGGLLGGAAGAGSTVGGVANGVGNTVGNVGASAGSTVNSTANGTVNGQLSSTSTGVIGLRGLQLDSAASNATTGSVITSTGKDVKLDSGTQLLLQAH